ncbi:PTS system trehalose-specific EIIBC component [Clostridium sp. CF011]|uniref:PTS system trehalose-specific EIIBC component n=1 Tax=Clostridium sp. CF011 TaxID=2843318 RepID=UPI001C0E0992|nr:PTS system trehalose-specific EIIBC component [Clostridium sp. CF011]MBU3090518.1 PTS system trehalose-specific EIIBC component [Clostridium sp. CF011]WAG69879.1 PTS system trehalose-specific EIIBC component [Clostridium sp. CF011]
MSKYTEDSKRLLEYIGGKENIVAVSHCATRMRFVLKDDKKADGKKIKSIKLVKGTFMQAGQFQVIIGNEVPDFYNEFVNVSGVDGVSKDKAKIEAKGNMNFIQRMLANLAEIFTPLIPALIVGGLILGFRNVIGDIKFLENGTKTITQMYPFWAGVHSFLWLIGEAIFNFLPVGITWAISKKMGTTQILGIVLGLTLVSPQLLNAYDVAGAAADKIPFWNFGAFHIQMIGYQAQVIPAIMAGFLLAIFEKNVRKIVPEYISMIVVPFLALVPTVIIAHTVLGPIGWAIGSVISSVVYTGLTSAFGWLFAAVFGFFYAPLVITGLHHMSNAIDLQLMAEFGGTNLWPMIALSNIAQGSAVMAIIRINKKAKPEEEQVSIPAAISCYLGVTEPAIFGINLKYVYPFLAAMVGSAIAGVISVSSGVMANSIGVGGIPGILSIKPKYMLIFSLAMIVAIVVSFTLTLILSKTKFAAKFAPED